MKKYNESHVEPPFCHVERSETSRSEKFSPLGHVERSETSTTQSQTSKTQNLFLQFYGAHHISPVSQDISDFALHLRRRARLYELLGIHTHAFKNATMLEVGAGSGYNTLLFLKLGAFVDIVEPNAAGREKMIELFRQYNVPDSSYCIHPCTLQDYTSTKQYDFVIAEGFLPWLVKVEREQVISKLLASTCAGGAIVTTTMCEFSFFYEDLRRILGLKLVAGIKGFKEKVNALSQAFKTHLDSLIFASRPIQDWVVDNILNPAADLPPMNLKMCVEEFAHCYSINNPSSMRGGGNYQ